jgi:hypothetical protein
MLTLEDVLMSFSSPLRRNANLARQLALAVVLASSATVLAVPGFADAAHAQKKKKKDDKPEEVKAVYSEAFVAAYQPVIKAL